MTVFPFLSIPVAAAVPPPQGGARITGVEHVNDRWDKVSVYSPSMDKVIVNDVFKAPKTGSPTFYLLPGIDGGDNLDPGASFAPGTKSWFGMTDIQGFFANKNANVVSPLGGQFSWYTDWINDSSKQYQTYTTRELPPLINAEYKANGKNAVGGLSSTGDTAIDYAIQAPGLYKAVGSYSGFPSVSDPDEAQQVSLTLSGGGATAENMWGPLGGPGWVAHDPSKNAAKLKGVAVYAAASAGGEGDVDRLPPDCRISPAGSSRASSRAAPSDSSMPRRPPGYRSTTSFGPRAPTHGASSSRRCKSHGTPRSAGRWGLMGLARRRPARLRRGPSSLRPRARRRPIR
jgi:diacylglycerol O-acyltransferase/trehalose O-mycolyltransferase